MRVTTINRKRIILPPTKKQQQLFNEHSIIFLRRTTFSYRNKFRFCFCSIECRYTIISLKQNTVSWLMMIKTKVHHRKHLRLFEMRMLDFVCGTAKAVMTVMTVTSIPKYEYNSRNLFDNTLQFQFNYNSNNVALISCRILH